MIRVIAGFGSEAIAGYIIGLRVIMFALLPALGLSNAAATLVGQNLGAGKPERAEKAVWKAAFFNAAFYVAIGLIFIFFANQIVGIFTDEAAVFAYGTDCLRIVAYGFVFYGFGMVLETAFNGAGDTWTPTYLNLFIWLFEIPLAYLLAYHFDSDRTAFSGRSRSRFRFWQSRLLYCSNAENGKPRSFRKIINHYIQTDKSGWKIDFYLSSSVIICG